MKKVLMFVVLSGLWACDTSEAGKSSRLTGSWRWVQTTGGFAGVNETPQDGEIRILKLNADKTYSVTRNDSLLVQGVYSVSKGASMLQNKEADLIVLGEGLTMVYEVKGNELYLAEDVYDGFNYTYERK